MAALTGTYWAGTWQGGAHRDEPLDRLAARLRLLLTLRSEQFQLAGLLSPAEVVELRAEPAAVFAPFGALPPLHHSTFASAAWEGAHAQYASLMAPIERVAARSLQARLAGSLRGVYIKHSSFLKVSGLTDFRFETSVKKYCVFQNWSNLTLVTVFLNKN